MALDKITYSPSDVLTSDQMNKIQDEVINNTNNIETHLNDINPHNIDASTLGVSKFAYGSYVGTGVCGKNNPNSLTFDFEPKFIFIQNSSNYTFDILALLQGVTRTGRDLTSGTTGNEIFIQWSGNTVQWYYHSSDSDNASRQKNKLNDTYYYIALG